MAPTICRCWASPAWASLSEPSLWCGKPPVTPSHFSGWTACCIWLACATGIWPARKTFPLLEVFFDRVVVRSPLQHLLDIRNRARIVGLPQPENRFLTDGKISIRIRNVNQLRHTLLPGQLAKGEHRF